MIFTETKLKGSFIIEIEKLEDERGFFARAWDKKIFEQYRIDTQLAQASIAYSRKKGTLRGMHYQISPYEETKLIRCTRGKIYDVIVDLRPPSNTFKKWVNVELSQDNYKMIYLPKGFAHGYQTMEDNSEVFYQMSEVHMPQYERGLHWNDPAFSIVWPIEKKIISDKDNSWNLFEIK